jgi:hypothetical protein
MNRLLTALAVAALLGPVAARAETACEFQAKLRKLGGAAKASFLKKCHADAARLAGVDCAKLAVDRKGQPLAGAAREAFIAKCERDAAAR